MQIPPRSRAWVELSVPALRRNYRRIAAALGPEPWVVPMVKADGYGLGAAGVVRWLQPEAPAGWGVATVQEGIDLREGGVTGRIIVFTPLTPAMLRAALTWRLSVAVSDVETLHGLAAEARRLGRPASVQLEVDTGMGRSGLPAHEVGRWGPAVRPLLAAPDTPDDAGHTLVWEGLFTHLHSADEPGGPGVLDQVAVLDEVTRALRPPEGVVVHVANSAGALRLGASAGGARPGIFLYGGGVGEDLPAPDPVVAVRARVVRVVEMPAGSTLGYGATHRAHSDERWATLAIGYGDGLPRILGNRGYVLIAGRRVPIVGRVSMDVTVANISTLDGVEPGDVATLVGRDGPAEITLDEVAALSGTISYEVLTGLSPRLPRVWTEAE
jgi:alanine racemase